MFDHYDVLVIFLLFFYTTRGPGSSFAGIHAWCGSYNISVLDFGSVATFFLGLRPRLEVHCTCTGSYLPKPLNGDYLVRTTYGYHILIILYIQITLPDTKSIKKCEYSFNIFICVLY